MNFDEIQKLIQRLDGSSITSFSIEEEHFSLSLEFQANDFIKEVIPDQHASSETSKNNLSVIKSPNLGTFHHCHPFSNQPAASPGQDVTPDIIVGYLISGDKVISVYPPTSGTLEGFKVADSQVVGYGDIIAILT